MITDVPTPCFQRQDIFLSTQAADYYEAAAMCAGCPMRGTPCQNERDDAARLFGNDSLEGTWDGKPYGEALINAIRRDQANKRARPSCGTTRGYRAHTRNGEDTCTPCADAEATRSADRRAKAKEESAA